MCYKTDWFQELHHTNDEKKIYSTNWKNMTSLENSVVEMSASPAVVAWWFSVCFIRSVTVIWWIESPLRHGTMDVNINY